MHVASYVSARLTFIPCLHLQVMDRAVTHVDNVYNLPDVCITGQVCRTNIPSNTAFRGFGAPQAMLVCEHLMENVATTLKLPPEKVRRGRGLAYCLELGYAHGIQN